MLNHFISIIMILVFAFGVQIFISLVVIVFNNRSKQAVQFLEFYGLLSLKIILMTFQSYLALFFQEVPFTLEIILLVANLVISPALLYFFIRLFVFFAKVRFDWLAAALTTMVTGLVAASFILPPGVRIFFQEGVISYGWLYDLGNIAFYACLLIPSAYIVLRTIITRDQAVPVVVFAGLLLLFLPALALEEFSLGYLPNAQTIGFSDRGVSLALPLLYQAINTLLFYFGVKYGYLFASMRSSGHNRISTRLLQRYAISEREAEVIGHIAQGLKNREIAELLFISPATVRNHIYNIFQKTGSQSRTGLISTLTE